MDIYKYDSITLEYIGSAEARKDPLEHGKYLLPAFAMFTQPPATSVNEVAVANQEGTGWIVEPDFRETKYWVGYDEHVIEDIGHTIPEGAVTDNPGQPPISAGDARDSALKSLVHDFGDGRIIQCRPPKFAQDESNMRNAIERMSRLSIPTQEWYMNDNTKAEVTAADLQTAIDSGQDQAAVIWADFFTSIGG
jgi:hypothetical protein